jgi:hypothetical protein
VIGLTLNLHLTLEKKMHGNDWKLLLKAVHPQGDVCIENNERVIRGPLEKVYVDERDNVVITVKWSGIKKIGSCPLYSRY